MLSSVPAIKHNWQKQQLVIYSEQHDILNFPSIEIPKGGIKHAFAYDSKTYCVIRLLSGNVDSFNFNGDIWLILMSECHSVDTCDKVLLDKNVAWCAMGEVFNEKTFPLSLRDDFFNQIHTMTITTTTDNDDTSAARKLLQ